MLPFVTGEVPFCRYVCELASGVDVVVNLGVKIDPVKQPVESHPVGSGYVSHRWTCAFNDHVDHRFFVLKSV